MRSAIEAQAANFSDDRAQGVEAYVEQLVINHPGLGPETAATDAQLAVAVAVFTTALLNALAD